MNITSLQATGLDQNFSPLMPSNPSTRPDEKAVEACRPIRNVDWREDPQPVENFHQRLVAHWQRCIVNYAGEKMQSGGGCMNWVFYNKAHYCSLRERDEQDRFTGNFTEQWATDYLATQTSPHSEISVDKENADSTSDAGGPDTTAELCARLKSENPFPSAPDGSPGWNQDLYRSPLFLPDGLDAESSLQEMLRTDANS
ncbi:uncharacterized protein N7473_000574 [Penicillium subrubescens]|uniref:uncharacterized protein n=1 Tax=Penicillium subrubescens TaxID=1316194 RepID=UPI002544F9EB|nr:uncharacterized protein N7473_000574 [Penicillium subrubescens]KAJ5911271.1 hypothetical protein N7473_000574 [Penicillium subrubescens]